MITLPWVTPLFAEVVQADFDQCGSMWMSVQPEGATWRRKGWWPSALSHSLCVCVCGRELRHIVSCFSTWCITLTKYILNLQMTLSQSLFLFSLSVSHFLLYGNRARHLLNGPLLWWNHGPEGKKYLFNWAVLILCADYSWMEKYVTSASINYIKIWNINLFHLFLFCCCCSFFPLWLCRDSS